MLILKLFLAWSLIRQVNLRDIPNDPCKHLEARDKGRKLVEMFENGVPRKCCGCPPNYYLQTVCKTDDYNSTVCVKCEEETFIKEKAHAKKECIALSNLTITTQAPSSTERSTQSTTMLAPTNINNVHASNSNTVQNILPWLLTGMAFGILLLLLLIQLTKKEEVKWKDIFHVFFSCCSNDIEVQNNEEKDAEAHELVLLNIEDPLTYGQESQQEDLQGSSDSFSPQPPPLDEAQESSVCSVQIDEATAITEERPITQLEAQPSDETIPKLPIDTCSKMITQTTNDVLPTKECEISLLKKELSSIPYKHKTILLENKDACNLARKLNIGEIDCSSLSSKNAGNIIQHFVDIVTFVHNRDGKEFTAKIFIDKMKEAELLLVAQTIEQELNIQPEE